MRELRIGIIGSRRRSSFRDRKMILDLVRELVETTAAEIVIVSGGCRKGADSFAEEAAHAHGLRKSIHPVPDDPPVKHRGEFRERAFARNLLVAQDCHVMYALVSDDRTGGTENTLGHMGDLKKDYWTIDSSGRRKLNG